MARQGWVAFGKWTRLCGSSAKLKALSGTRAPLNAMLPIAVEPPVIMTKFLFFNFVFPYGCYYNRISICVNHNAFKKDSNVNLRLTVFWIGSHMLKHGEPLVCPVPVFGLPRTCSTHRLHAGWWLPTYWYGAEDPWRETNMDALLQTSNQN